MENQNRLKVLFWRRAFSALIDVVLIYCISFIVQQLVIRFFFIDSFTVFWITWILYYPGCYFLLRGRTLVKMITGLQVTGMTNPDPGARDLLVREVVCKFFFLLMLPVSLINGLHIYKPSQLLIPSVLMIAFTITMLVLFFVFKKPWWEMVSLTKTIKNPVSNKGLRLGSFLTILCIAALTVFVKTSPFFKENARFSTTFYPEYPVNSETREYAEFVKTHAQNPVDYVFGLFDKYDLVVLNERVPHSEYTQYELITRIVSDKRFADKVGNIYTELGSISYQDTLHTYLNTAFPAEDSLNKATALLQRSCNPIWPLWPLTNMFDLLKHVNKINMHTADSLKINWYFTDMPVDWETMTPEKWQNAPKDKRDQIMAEHIIDSYKTKPGKHEKSVKGLVIMNARHGYGLIRDAHGNRKGHYYSKINTTELLMEALPGKVCNVMINTVPFGLGIFWGQVQNGKWDKAFSLAGNPDEGFNFANSPFGSDNFDGAIGFPTNELKYEDVFTGFVFYKPLEQFVNKTGFPYMLYNFNDSLIRRAGCISESFADTWKTTVKYYENDKMYTDGLQFAVFYNLIVNVAFSVIIIITMIICGIFYKTKPS
ncbi:MAG: RDD family protein [Bacteroidetes bacterium]|nr:RDD family protein [Bacteroidota bacterium]